MLHHDSKTSAVKMIRRQRLRVVRIGVATPFRLAAGTLNHLLLYLCGYSVLGKGRLRAVWVSGCSPLLLADLGVPGLDLRLWVTEVFGHRLGNTELTGSNSR
jgi:hypothetical protein